MKRTFRLLDQFRDVVQRGSWAEVAEVSSINFEACRSRSDGALRRQSTSQRFVHYLAERPIGSPHLSLEFGCNVIVKGEGSPHDLMLMFRHHDVNRACSFDIPSTRVVSYNGYKETRGEKHVDG